MDIYKADEMRYSLMPVRRCGRSGLILPEVSLGLWQNFGSTVPLENARKILRKAFDLGIFHFDLANNYGPEPGSAEENFGRIFADDFKKHRDELIISSKAGFRMWPGPFGEWGSRKSLIASCDQSLKRMQIDYVDIFYHHRPDPDTPLEESMSALDHIVRSGRALYVGLSNYCTEDAAKAFAILRELKTPGVIYQGCFNMLDRTLENTGMFKMLSNSGIGGICFCPLAQGLLTDKYLHGIPADSRAARNGSLRQENITPELIAKISKLNTLAAERGQTLPQMALSWILSRPGVTSVLCGASSIEQIIDSAKSAGSKVPFTPDEYDTIEAVLKD